MIFTTYTKKLDVQIRACVERDIPKLSWFGMFDDHLKIIRQAYDDHISGNNIFLVADLNEFPIGQVWIDLIKKQDSSTGHIWAFRVFDPFQGLGIGSRLLKTAEDILCQKRYVAAELGVEKNNIKAKELYEKNGYIVVDEIIEKSVYTNPRGETVCYTSEQWILRKSLENNSK